MITVIGGSGFIGTRLCQNLAERQIAFEIIDLRKSGRFPDKTKVADIRDLDVLRDAVTGDAIINLAAVHRDDVRDKSEYYTTNVDGTRNVCQVASEKGIKSIIFTSTVAVYGFAAADTREDGDINPFNDYGKSKFEGEELLRDWYHKGAAYRDLIIVRPTVVFGEGNRGNVYNLLRQVASGRFLMVGDGQNRKSMAYVGNLAAFLEAAVENGAGYQLYNYIDKPDLDMNTLISQVRGQLSGKPRVGPRLPYWFGLLLGHLADGVARITGKNLPVSSIRVRKFCATTVFESRAEELDGFTRPFSLLEALRRTVNVEFVHPDPSREVFFTE
ncbi:NAD-dependent epimerase/dehydratase family protein [Sulfitobacter sp. 1A15299]|uniref:NAD-dependent epimerase/dehydratase family protein n=1 Tax=Sulfitobacter sp. 1A15299 TaxID=3368598 RepID=UPI003746B727